MSVLGLFALLAAIDGGAEPAAAVDGGRAIDGGATVPAAVTAPAALPSGDAIYAVATREPVVALTFDACATLRQPNGFDRRVWEILSAERIPVTLYLSGRWVEKHPSAAKLIAAAPFVELGNHSYSHPRLTLLRKDRLRMQIARTNKILEKHFGRKPSSLRPPAGAWDARVAQAARKEGLPVVTWTVVSGDVGGHVPPARMVHGVLEQARPGAIIIFHINHREPYTKAALPGVIAGLRAKGFRFVTVSELLALPDAVPELAKPSHWGFGRPKRPQLASPPAPQPEPAPVSQGEPHADPDP
jgi:peptidoglycan-N-acetylglucosamine deacetylase